MSGNPEVEPQDAECRLNIVSDVRELRRMSSWLRKLLGGVGLAEPQAYMFELCANEAIANIVLHASGAQPSERIRLTFQASDEWASLHIEDKARGFDPIAAQLPGLAATLEEAVPGGKGLVLIRRLLPESTYERTAESNVLVLRSRL